MSQTRGDNASVVTIGNFDGIHRGHQALVHRCAQLRKPGESLAVLTFEPLPQAFFQPDAAPARLSTVYQKLTLLKAEKTDLVWMLSFDQTLSELSAREFVEKVLVKGLQARQIVVGADFRFGHRREGDVDTLKSLGEEYGFGVELVPVVYAGNERISSTAIRRYLSEANFDRAAVMLGRSFRMEGHVVIGQQLGRKLGFPTVNLRIRAKPSPLRGVFAVFVREQGAQGAERGWKAAVSSIGWRPTVGGKEPLLEVHIFDFNRDVYGRRFEVEFVAKLRDEAHFPTVDEMVTQMRLDEAEARTILAQTERPV